MKKLKIIFNLITLALTTGLLVMITLAWYAVNKTASVNEAIGCTASGKNLYLSTTYSGADSFHLQQHLLDLVLMVLVVLLIQMIIYHYQV